MTFSPISVLKNERVIRTAWEGARFIRALASQLRSEKDSHSPELIVEANESDLLEALGRAGYVYPWFLSFHYRGEDRNLARFFYDDESSDRFPFRQDHIRLYVDEHPSGEIGLAGHTEPSSVTHPKAHLDRDAEIELAIHRIERLLTDADVPYRESPGWSAVLEIIDHLRENGPTAVADLKTFIDDEYGDQYDSKKSAWNTVSGYFEGVSRIEATDRGEYRYVDGAVADALERES